MSKKAARRYSQSFKQAVVKEYEAGSTIEALRAKYGIGGGSTIQRWIEQYGREGLRHKLLVIQQPDEQKRLKELQKQIRQLEQVVAQLTVEKLVLSSSLAEAEARLGYGLKKKPEQRSSSAPTSKPEGQE